MSKKSLGQHWLRDKELLKHIQNTSSLQSGDTLIEIGPGNGALTTYLEKVCTKAQCEQVFLIEKDDNLIKVLRLKFPKYQILHQDILEVDVQDLYSGSPLVIYGNLPYNISVAIIKKLCGYSQLIRTMTFLVQKEVGDRLVATQGKNYSPLSIYIQLYFEVQVVRTVPPEAFVPAPKVHSSLLKLLPKHSSLVPLITDMVLFQKVLQLAFMQRRKKLRNTLGRYYNLQNLDPDLRPEQISLQDWINLVNNLKLI
jgi:16S rRNA (adenine1518-N6/adenine1519-N6)-dimethyltransferase